MTVTPPIETTPPAKPVCAECEFHRDDPRGVPPHDHELELSESEKRLMDGNR